MNHISPFVNFQYVSVDFSILMFLSLIYTSYLHAVNINSCLLILLHTMCSRGIQTWLLQSLLYSKLFSVAPCLHSHTFYKGWSILILFRAESSTPATVPGPQLRLQSHRVYKLITYMLQIVTTTYYFSFNYFWHLGHTIFNLYNQICVVVYNSQVLTMHTHSFFNPKWWK